MIFVYYANRGLIKCINNRRRSFIESIYSQPLKVTNYLNIITVVNNFGL